MADDTEWPPTVESAWATVLTEIAVIRNDVKTKALYEAINDMAAAIAAVPRTPAVALGTAFKRLLTLYESEESALPRPPWVTEALTFAEGRPNPTLSTPARANEPPEETAQRASEEEHDHDDALMTALFGPAPPRRRVLPDVDSFIDPTVTAEQLREAMAEPGYITGGFIPPLHIVPAPPTIEAVAAAHEEARNALVRVAQVEGALHLHRTALQFIRAGVAVEHALQTCAIDLGPTPAQYTFAGVDPTTPEGHLRSALWDLLGGQGAESVEDAARRVVAERDRLAANET